MTKKINPNMNGKSVYEKPVLSSIKLMADEVLNISSCKTSGGTSVSGVIAGSTPCSTLSCKTIGS